MLLTLWLRSVNRTACIRKREREKEREMYFYQRATIKERGAERIRSACAAYGSSRPVAYPLGHYVTA